MNKRRNETTMSLKIKVMDAWRRFYNREESTWHRGRDAWPEIWRLSKWEPTRKGVKERIPGGWFWWWRRGEIPGRDLRQMCSEIKVGSSSLSLEIWNDVLKQGLGHSKHDAEWPVEVFWNQQQHLLKKKKKSLTLSVNMKRSGVVGNEVRDFGKSQWFAVSPAPLCGGEAGVGGSPPLKP